MHKLMDSSGSSSSDSKTEFTTRVVTLSNVDVYQVLPYVLAVLEGVGIGVAQAVKGIGTHGAILLTTPVGLSHFLDSTIKTTLDNKDLAKFGHAVFYPPAIFVQQGEVGAESNGGFNPQDVFQVITSLRLVPPDMKCELVQIDNTRAAILVSGSPNREADFKSDVLPSLTRLVHSLEKTGFPLS